MHRSQRYKKRSFQITSLIHSAVSFRNLTWLGQLMQMHSQSHCVLLSHQKALSVLNGYEYKKCAIDAKVYQLDAVHFFHFPPDGVSLSHPWFPFLQKTKVLPSLAQSWLFACSLSQKTLLCMTPQSLFSGPPDQSTGMFTWSLIPGMVRKGVLMTTGHHCAAFLFVFS